MKIRDIVRRPLNALLITVGFISFAGLFLANDDPFVRRPFCDFSQICFNSSHAAAFNKFAYDVAVGSIVSLIFYGLIVLLPEWQKRQRYKRLFSAQYKNFKKGCIGSILAAADGSYGSDLLDSLSDQNSFRQYFDVWVSPDQTRWHRFCNQLDNYHLREIITHLEILRDEIAFILSSVDVPSDRPLRFLRRLSAAIYTYRNSSLSYDDVKRFSGFLWDLFAGFDIIDGYREHDIIQEMIDAI